MNSVNIEFLTELLAPEKETVTLTVAQLIDAMEKNGYEQNFDGSWIRVFPDTMEVVSACALGQASINLGVFFRDVKDELYPLSVGTNLKASIYEWNDSNHLSCQEIAELVRENYSKLLDKQITVRKYEYKIKEAVK